VLAALTKESVAPFAVAALFLWPRRPSTFATGAALVAVGVVSVVLVQSGQAQYGLVRGPVAYMGSVAWSFAVAPAMWLAPFALRTRFAVAAAGLWLVGVYVYAGHEAGRYLLPGVVVGVAGTLWILRQRPGLVPVAWVAVALALSAQTVEAAAWAQRSRDWHDLVARVEATSGPLVVTFGDWGRREETYALIRYVGPRDAVLIDPPNPPPDWHGYTDGGPLTYRTGEPPTPCVAVALSGAEPWAGCAVVVRWSRDHVR
jgi:hypothetical protein